MCNSEKLNHFAITGIVTIEFDCNWFMKSYKIIKYFFTVFYHTLFSRRPTQNHQWRQIVFRTFFILRFDRVWLLTLYSSLEVSFDGVTGGPYWTWCCCTRYSIFCFEFIDQKLIFINCLLCILDQKRTLPKKSLNAFKTNLNCNN